MAEPIVIAPAVVTVNVLTDDADALKLLHAIALFIVTVPVPEFASNTRSVLAVGVPAPPAPPDVEDQFAAVARLPVPPT